MESGAFERPPVARVGCGGYPDGGVEKKEGDGGVVENEREG